MGLLPEIMPMGAQAKEQIDPYVLAITIFTFACVAVAGTAVAIYLEVRLAAAQMLWECRSSCHMFALSRGARCAI